MFFLFIAYRIVQNLYLSGCNLSRSVSSAGEHQSDQFLNQPILPKRAETFGGFDHNAAALARLLQKFTASSSNNNVISTTSTITTTTCSSATTNTIIDKLVEKSKDTINEEQLSLEVKSRFDIKTEKEENAEKLAETTTTKIINTNEANSPSILINTVLPMHDPNELISQLSTLPLLISQLEHSRSSVDSELSLAIPQSKHEQVIQIVELQHQLNLLLCLFHHQQTLFEFMRLNLQDINPSLTASNQQQTQSTSASTLALNTLSTSNRLSPSKNATTSTMHSNALPISSLNKKFKAEDQLEELRNLHEQFSAEKQSFEKRTKELDKREALLQQEKEDLNEQRENLNRKLENLQDEYGISMLSSGNLSASAKLASLSDNRNDELALDQQLSARSKITRNRLSSGDLQVVVKQQIPLKLAVSNNQLSMSKSCNNTPNISPNISPSITFDAIHCLQTTSKSTTKNQSVSNCSSTATPPSPKPFKVSNSRKESNQSSNQPITIESTADDKNEEEIFC